MKALKTILSGCLSLLCAGAATAKDIPLSYRTDVSEFIYDVSHKYHIPGAELAAMFDRVEIQPKIIEAIERPYEAKPWTQYRSVFVTKERAAAGAKFWKEHARDLQRAEKMYGVPAPIIIAILGVETNYGQRQGQYRVIDALTTLAFNYPARAPFFRKELAEYILLTRENKLDPFSLYGSYAGAIGQPQFMPSSYRHYAVDFSGHGRSDLRNSTTDVIGSVANYFKQNGWRHQGPVVQRAVVTSNRPRIDTTAKTPNYSLAQLNRSGIRPSSPIPGTDKVGVIALDPQNAKQMWIAHPNFYVITRYNTSKQYAMAVYQLSEAIKKEHLS